jgi:hypothetical protein
MELFHYCSTQTAFSILSKRTIWLSPLSSANDSLEGKLVGLTFKDQLKETELPRATQELASFFAQSLHDSTEAFAFCLSEDGDLLSQWRAYGDNGAGFSIGFDSNMVVADFGEVNFGSKFFEMRKVRYGSEGLAELVEPIVKTVVEKFLPHGEFARFNDGITVEEALSRFSKRDPSDKLVKPESIEAALHILELSDLISKAFHFRIYEIKPTAFQEEREWRLIRYRHLAPHPEISFRSSNSAIRPYIECLMADPAKEAIKSVILGPRNTSEPSWIRAFLDSCGLGHVKVTKSQASSYRS